MPGQPQARIRGIPNIPSITEVNVRSSAGTNQGMLFKIPVGMSGLTILEVRPDIEQKQMDNKVYQWFHLRFHGGADGWVRDDLIEITGDCQDFGYPDLGDYTFAFALTRSPSSDKKATSTMSAVRDEPNSETGSSGSMLLSALVDTERVRKASFAITSAFEGTGYASYNNYDAGIISYGFLQFTLASGSLGRVLENYVARTDSDLSKAVENYLPRVQQKDSLLRNDSGFRTALVNAAADEAMQAVQEEIGTSGYWQAVVDGYIMHRGLRLPLTWALLFDMGVNFGVNHGFVRLAEKQLGVLPRSKPGENGITEEQLMTRVAQLRKQSHDRQAERDNLPGLRRRGNFWMALVNTADWHLQGDEFGAVHPNGRRIMVRTA
ncbi:MAG: chitosanase [Anaerolineae bacterium]|nr:chitosanase [Anaerolineae bacterium]